MSKQALAAVIALRQALRPLACGARTCLLGPNEDGAPEPCRCVGPTHGGEVVAYGTSAQDTVPLREALRDLWDVQVLRHRPRPFAKPTRRVVPPSSKGI